MLRKSSGVRHEHGMPLHLLAHEIYDAFAEFGKWWKIALFTLKRQYATTLLGPLWLFLPNFFFIAVVGTVFSTAFDVSGFRYYAYVAVGYLVWLFIVDSFQRGGNLFVTEYGRYAHIRTNLFGVILKDVIARSIVLAINLAICIVLFGAIQGEVRGLAWAAIGFLLLFVNSFMQSYWLSALSARFRDLTPAVASVMRLMFFITPIFWFASSFKNGWRIIFLHVNPFYYLIEVIRAPLLDGVLPADVALLAGAWTLANAIVFVIVATLSHRRIAYDAA